MFIKIVINKGKQNWIETYTKRTHKLCKLYLDRVMFTNPRISNSVSCLIITRYLTFEFCQAYKLECVVLVSLFLHCCNVYIRENKNISLVLPWLNLVKKKYWQAEKYRSILVKKINLSCDVKPNIFKNGSRVIEHKYMFL